MNEYDVKRLALVLAVQAEIEGMKAENQYRKVYDHEPTYNNDDFRTKALELNELAHKHNEQL